MAFFDQFQHLKIRLTEIRLATNNFGAENLIGNGGFGKVYKGEICHSKGRGMVAFKRLDGRFGQGNSEFWREIMMLSRYTHENLVSLLGYCDEDGEKILVYEYASHGSLDRHLSATTFTWTQRLKICLAAATGLSYLHDPKGTQQRVLHRDIKSANILLDENWNAKVSDFGLSKIGPANHQHTVLISNGVGTPGYCDPLYMEMYMLTKESDVYSFGVLLFEVLCGRLCFRYSDGQYEILVPKWKQSYELKKLDEIIFPDMLQQINPRSLKIFSDIAYQCLQRRREERPTMAHIMNKLEIALESQEIIFQEPMDYEKMAKTAAVPPLTSVSKEELGMLLSMGILINAGKTWFSLDKNGEHCEMISASECLFPKNMGPLHDTYEYNSRFAAIGNISSMGKFKTHVKTQFLSPHITYTINLVFKFKFKDNPLSKPSCLYLEYKLEEEKEYSISYLAYPRGDGWLMAELYQFTSNRRQVEFDILFQLYLQNELLVVEGIEFRPLNQVEQISASASDVEDENMNMQLISDSNKKDGDVNIQSVSDSDIYWEQKLPNDYKEIISWSRYFKYWTTKKELYFVFRKGFLVNDNQEWFFLTKNGKKCSMQSARIALKGSEWRMCLRLNSRFGEVKEGPIVRFSIVCRLNSQLLSPQTTYACYLVYEIHSNSDLSKFLDPVRVTNKGFHLNDCHLKDFWYIYLASPKTPVIRPKVDQETYNPSNIPKMKGLPQLRNDGWMEVQVWEFQTGTTTETVSMNIDLITVTYKRLDGLRVLGIEFKPL